MITQKMIIFISKIYKYSIYIFTYHHKFYQKAQDLPVLIIAFLKASIIGFIVI
jgi:hypothetical protein